MKHRILFISFLFLGSTLLGQSSETAKVRTIYDLSYLSPDRIEVDSLQRLNLSLPKTRDQAPLLIWIGGGAWSYVDRHADTVFAKALAQEGIAVASIGHRLSPATWRDPNLAKGVQHPKHIEDLAAAVAWLHAHAKEYDLDPNRFFVAGFSSGAHLAALLTLDPRYLEKEGLSTDLIKGMIPISGTYDIPDYHRVFVNGNNPELAQSHVEAVFGEDAQGQVNASPVNYLSNLSCPILLMSDGSIDGYTRLFEERIRQEKFKALEAIYAEDLSHVELWRDLNHGSKSVYRKFLLDFIWVNSRK